MSSHNGTLNSMHASAVDAWSTHIINMLVEMDVVFVANDSTTSQGKKSENKETTCDVRVESVKKTLPPSSHRSSRIHSWEVHIACSDTKKPLERKTGSIKMVVDFLNPTHIQICTKCTSTAHRLNVSCMQICFSAWFNIWRKYGMTFMTMHAGCADFYRDYVTLGYDTNCCIGSVLCCSLAEAPNKKQKRFRNITFQEMFDSSRKKMYRIKSSHRYGSCDHLGTRLIEVLSTLTRSLGHICVCDEIICKNNSTTSNGIDVQCRKISTTNHTFALKTWF